MSGTAAKLQLLGASHRHPSSAAKWTESFYFTSLREIYQQNKIMNDTADSSIYWARLMKLDEFLTTKKANDPFLSEPDLEAIAHNDIARAIKQLYHMQSINQQELNELYQRHFPYVRCDPYCNE